MSKSDLRATIIQAVLDAALTMPIIWPNSSQAAPQGTTWARGAILRTDGAGGSLGPGGKDKFNGSLEFKIFTKPKTTEAEGYRGIGEIEAVVKRGAALFGDGAQIRITATGTRPGETLTGWHVNILRAEFFAYTDR